jgi:protocatechuate 3,4-dioxygenase beta subunit
MTLHAGPFAARLGLAAVVALCSGVLMAQTPPGPPDPTSPPRDSSGTPVPSAAAGVVRGRVIAADTGLPLRRVTVSLRSSGEERGLSTDTDAAGAFVFEAVPPGRYRLKASKARYVDTPLGARVPGGRGSALDVGEGQKIEGLTIALPLAGVIAGRVVDDAGEPVAGAQVMAVQRKRVSGAPRAAPSMYGGATDDMGMYRLFGLSPGRYYLLVRGDERHVDAVNVVHTSPTSLAPTYYPSTPVASEAQPVDVAAATETTADIALVATQVTTVSGEVVDAAGRTPVAGFITLLAAGVDDDPARQFSGSQVLTKSGAFTLSGVAPGDYTLIVRAFFDEAEMMRTVSSGTIDGAGFSMPLTVSGSSISDLRIVVPPPIAIAGRVHFEGEPPSGGAAAVSILASGLPENTGAATRTQVSADGHFTAQVPAGTWRFTAWAPGGWMVKRLQFRGRAIEPGAPVDVTGEPDARLDVLLTSQLTVVTGTASDTKGAPLVHYHAVIFPAEHKDQRWGDRTRIERADAQGRFRVEGLLPGDYLMAAVDDLEPGDAFDEEVLAALRPGATRVRVRHGQTESVALRLAPIP